MDSEPVYNPSCHIVGQVRAGDKGESSSSSTSQFVWHLFFYERYLFCYHLLWLYWWVRWPLAAQNLWSDGYMEVSWMMLSVIPVISVTIEQICQWLCECGNFTSGKVLTFHLVYWVWLNHLTLCLSNFNDSALSSLGSRLSQVLLTLWIV